MVITYVDGLYMFYRMLERQYMLKSFLYSVYHNEEKQQTMVIKKDFSF